MIRANSGVDAIEPKLNESENSSPTIPPYILRSVFVAGDVCGSVSITVPKNSTGNDSKNSSNAARGAVFRSKLRIKNTTVETNIKVKNKSNRRTFRTNNNPIISTNGRSIGVATHHVSSPDPAILKTSAAKAAGLNRCFLLTAKIYFDAMATTATSIKSNPSPALCNGANIKNRISAVINVDSLVEVALKSNVNTEFVTYAEKIRMSSEIVRSRAVNGSKPKKASKMEISANTIRP
jgi:hypothetical protein